MSAMISIHSDWSQISVECEEDGVSGSPTIWIRSHRDSKTVAINLSRADRAKLRAALDEADAIADKT